jgi:hypothetical protein
MSSERRLEYDKGPSLEDDPVEPTERTESEGENADSRNPTGRGERVLVAVAPWKAGPVAGVGAFVAVYVVMYQLASSMIAGGTFARAENEPSQWVIAGMTMLGSHGAPIEEGGEQVQGAYASMGMLASHVSALIPLVALVVVGYLLVRYVRFETAADAGLAIGTTAVAYVVPTVVLGLFSRWSPAETEPAPGETNPEPETLAIAVDASTVISTTLSVALFVAIGAALAALPRLLESAPLETTTAEPTAVESIDTEPTETETSP